MLGKNYQSTESIKIRVAILVWRDGFGGAERSIRDFAAALDQELLDVRFYFLSGDSSIFAHEITSLGYTVEFLHWKNGMSVAGRWRLLHRLRSFQPMIVHDHLIPPLTRPMVKLACKCPIVHTEHGEALRHASGGGGWRKWIARLDLSFCELVLANSKASFAAVQSAYGLLAPKVQLLYLGIDLQRFDNIHRDRKRSMPMRVGYVGRIINSLKGVDYLPLVARILCDMGCESVEFVIVGDGPDRPIVETLCREFQVSHMFLFMGWRSDVQDLLASFDVVIIPSRFESFGLVALESLAMNVKVIGFEVDGLSEAVGNCSAARLVPAGDVEGIAKLIVTEVTNLEQLPDSKGREFVEEHFSSQRMARDIERVYMDIVCSRSEGCEPRPRIVQM